MTRRGHGEGTIVLRSDGRWAAALRLGPGKGRRWFYGRTRREVQDKLAREVRARQLGGGTTGASPRLRDFLPAWLDSLTVRENTRRQYANVVHNHVLPRLGTIRVAELSVDDVQGAVNAIHRQGRQRTAAQVRAVISAALRAAQRREMVVRNVAALAMLPKATEREASWLNAEQAQRLIAVAEGDDYGAFYVAGLGLGLRPAETLGLRWADLDLDGALARVRVQLQWPIGKAPVLTDTKTARSRRPIPMPELVVAVLRRHRARQTERELAAKRWQNRMGLVFTKDDGSPVRQEFARARFRAALERAGLPRIGLYDGTRHTAASMLAAAGVHPKVAQQILGHANIETTLRIYTHVAPDAAVAAAQAMNVLLTPPS